MGRVSALGMIETVGLVGAIEAADAGLKAAQVKLLGTDYVRGGLVMVRFEGEVAAVQSAVDAGAAAAGRVGKVFSAHVIARAMPEVFCMLASDVGEGPARRASGGCASCGGCEGGRRACAAEPEHAEERAERHKGIDRSTPMEELRGWKVLALRQAARRLPAFPLTPAEIRYANKQTLLDAIARWRQGEA